MNALGNPHVHHAATASTNDIARAFAAQGAPHGTIVTAGRQTAGRGRRGRSWQTPPNQALLLSVILRGPPQLLTLRAGLAVAVTCGEDARLKWPNDVIVGDRKVAGILCERAATGDWAVAGIGVNVAVEPARLPPALRESAGTLGLLVAEMPDFRERLLRELERQLTIDRGQLLAGWTARDYLRGREVEWHDGRGVAAGIDETGQLIVDAGDTRLTLDAGEVSLVRAS